MALKAWREVAEPHPDVAAGRYQQAEFAADLAQVVAGTADPEYGDAREFWARTYLTAGMSRLLRSCAERLGGKGGDPVVQLKTVFGGGKTHTMLALYHLFGGTARIEELAGAEAIIKDAGLEETPLARIPVIVGTAISPSKSRSIHGVEVRTLWGDIACQIGGPERAGEAYALVAEADRMGVSPGANDLVQLFDEFGPALVLIDEFIAYARNIYGVDGLAAGSFDANMTFVQALTEAAKRSRRSLVVASIPESKVEIGNEAGQAALERIEHIFGRLEAIWQPVGAQESFEIVRRRLFKPITDEAARDATCRAFVKLYDSNADQFPPECGEGAYEARLRGAYPLHPELFDRLYDDWSSLERFQRTRGVLRLMASVIHKLWVENDRSFLILPGTLPLDALRVRDELLRYLPEGWAAIVDKDVDGERSEPRALDESNARFGQLLASRRVSRTVFLGSAPNARGANVRGIEDVRVRLGCVQPGESVATFNDALSRLTERSTHLYTGNGRYWFDTQPNLRRTMEERAGKFDALEITREIKTRLGRIRERGDFKGVHSLTEHRDVPDDAFVRLVVLPPDAGHRAGRTTSDAMRAATEILDHHGNGPRTCRNMLIFVAADAGAWAPLDKSLREWMAWTSIVEDAGTLNLDEHQRREARQGLNRANETVETRLFDAYAWLLVPSQDPEEREVRWEATRIAGGTQNPIYKAIQKTTQAGDVVRAWSPIMLKMELDKWLWRESDHVSLKRVWECLTTYLYLPRLRDVDVLLAAVRDGLRSGEFFAYAEGVEEKDGQTRYLVLQSGRDAGSIALDGMAVLVKPEAAQRQTEAEEQVRREREARLADEADTGQSTLPVNGEAGSGEAVSSGTGVATGGVARLQGASGGLFPTPAATRFYGSMRLDPDDVRFARQIHDVLEEVVQRLREHPGATVEISLDVQVTLPDGAGEDLTRTISENCRVLGFSSQGFDSAE